MIDQKIGRYISIRMGFTMSLIMSLVGSIRGAFNGTSVAFSRMPEEVQANTSFIGLFFSNWIPSFMVSSVLSCIFAITIGFIVPMKDINKGLSKIAKPQSFIFNLLHGLISGIIYVPILAIIMSFIIAAFFIGPRLGIPLVPAALGYFINALPFEFVFGVITAMIFEPIFQRNAMMRYSPSGNQSNKR